MTTTTPHPASDLLRDLSLLIRSRYGLIFLRTAEEDRAETLLSRLGSRQRSERTLGLNRQFGHRALRSRPDELRFHCQKTQPEEVP